MSTAPWWGAPAGAILGTGLGGWSSCASTKHYAQTPHQAQDLRDARDRVREIPVRSINEANADPGVHALARDPRRLGDVRLGPARSIPAHHQQAAMKRRTGITVGHENLRTGDGPSTSHTPPGGSLHIKPTRLLPTSCPGTP